MDPKDEGKEESLQSMWVGKGDKRQTSKSKTKTNV